ncbi:MAG: radical SAM protein [Acidobacteriaceae bacterium]
MAPSGGALASPQVVPENGWGERLSAVSRPRTRHAHWQNLGDRGLLFIADGTRIFDVDSAVIENLERACEIDDAEVESVLGSLGIELPGFVDDTPLQSPALHALSLAVAQKCNLGCSYCYAGQGGFGGPALNMSLSTAQQAIDLLVKSSGEGSRVNLAFLGGEPLANREVIRAATRYASSICQDCGIRPSFSITTNGTLLTESDAEFFEEFGFAVTVSLDGRREDHNKLRPFKDGTGSFDRIIQRVLPLLKMQQRMQVSVRATVTPGFHDLRNTLEYFLGMNFHSVGFSPVLRSPSGQGEMGDHDLMVLLDGMVDCGLEFERRTLSGERYAFMNIVNAFHEIHRGTHRPYPCGAGAGYLGVSASGDLSACHRFVGDSEGQMGNLVRGIDPVSQSRWLAERHVHKQTPCRECWARYLCSGGCHHEVIARGRTACTYIRGWLHYCLEAYDRMLKLRPDWFLDDKHSSGS